MKQRTYGDKRAALEIVREAYPSGDAWGDVMAQLFGIAEVLWHRGETIPYAWEYAHGATLMGELQRAEDCIGDQYPDCEYLAAYDAGQLDAAQLVYAGNVLMRYRDALKLAGRSY